MRPVQNSVAKEEDWPAKQMKLEFCCVELGNKLLDINQSRFQSFHAKFQLYYKHSIGKVLKKFQLGYATSVSMSEVLAKAMRLSA
jgi:hypothetical protein